VEWFQDFFSAFIGGFARIFISSFIIWMVGLIVLLFRELFSSEDFSFQKYLRKIWKVLLFSFEWCAYGAIVVGLILMYSADKYLTYLMVSVDAVILVLIYFNLRRRTRSKGVSNGSAER
jgi:hypothetical protein